MVEDDNSSDDVFVHAEHRFAFAHHGVVPFFWWCG